MKYYEGRLAPMLLQHIEADPSLQRGGGFDGTQGQPTCPRLGEDLQRRVEAKQGRARYLMQHMLITAALDKNRYALDTRQFVILRGPGRNGLWPIHVTRGMTDKHIRRVAAEYGTFDFSTPSFVSEQIAPLERVVASIDPAAGGANGDATAITVGGVLNHQLFLLGVYAAPGGYLSHILEEVASILLPWRLDQILIEKNMGHGAYASQLTPVLRAAGIMCGIEEPQVQGNKELRIADTLAPPLGVGKLLIDEAVLDMDAAVVSKFGSKTYSLFHQVAKLTRKRGSLKHDDAVDSLAELVAATPEVRGDPARVLQEALANRVENWVAKALGHSNTSRPAAGTTL